MSAEMLRDEQDFNSMRFIFTDPKYEFRLDEEHERIVACNVQEENHPRRVAVAETYHADEETHVSLKFDPLLGSTLNFPPQARLFAKEMILALQEGQLVPEDEQTVVEVELPPVGVEKARTLALFNQLDLPGVVFEPVRETKPQLAVAA